MLDTRPHFTVGTPLLQRNRLLEALPDTAGHVVWLRAPYGYGKSVLAAQWAAELEAGGWRVLWTASMGADVRLLLASAVGMPENVPWGLLHEHLWQVPTLLVIEDLEGREDLSPLLRYVGGLVLLASRGNLNQPELPRLQTQQRLHVIDTDQLAFTEEEARQLAGQFSADAAAAASGSWQQTTGWPLPLHFALLTGQYPESTSLVSGIRDSVSGDAWSEVLFLAAAGTIPRDAALPVTRELAAAGFVQELTAAYRLHPFLADRLLSQHPDEVRTQAAAQAGRLDLVARGHAFARTGHMEALSALLDTPGSTLHMHSSGLFLTWDALCPESTLLRRVRRCCATLRLGRIDDATPELDTLLARDDLEPRLRATLLGTAAGMLAETGRHDRARQALELTRGLEEQLDDEGRLSLAMSRAFAYGRLREFDAAFANYDTAARLAATTSGPRAEEARYLAAANLSVLHWQLHGDSEGQLAALRGIERAGPVPQEARAIHRYNVAFCLFNLGRHEEVLAELRQGLQGANPYWSLWLRVLEAHVTGNVAAFPELLTEARKWEQYESAERVSAVWIRTCRKVGDFETPVRIDAQLEPGAYVDLERALQHLHHGRHEEAAALLESTRGDREEREFRQQWHATSWQVHRRQEDLDVLMTLSAQPHKLLPFLLIPLDTLPHDRPGYSLGYPLHDVLASGWKEAVALRAAEIPPLELRLLGTFEARVFGKPVELAHRQQQILTLLALGLGRDELSEELWPEAEPERSANNLRVQYYMLRRSLEPWGHPTFLDDMRLVNAKVDLDALRDALDHGDVAKVLELYTRPLVPEFDTPAIDSLRLALQRRVCELLVSAAESSGDERLAVACLERVLELEPLHEDALRMLLEALVRLGRRRSAERRYEEFAELLRREAGLEPQAGTRAVLDNPA